MRTMASPMHSCMHRLRLKFQESLHQLQVVEVGAVDRPGSKSAAVARRAAARRRVARRALTRSNMASANTRTAFARSAAVVSHREFLSRLEPEGWGAATSRLVPRNGLHPLIVPCALLEVTLRQNAADAALKAWAVALLHGGREAPGEADGLHARLPVWDALVLNRWDRKIILGARAAAPC